MVWMSTSISPTDSTYMSELLEIGRINKPHGVRGDVIVTLITDRLERVATGTELTTKRGPLTIAASRPHHGGFIVTFDGVNTREAAEALAGTVLSAEALDDPDALWVHDLIGSEVVDTAGVTHGKVIAVLENPAHDLLELDSGALVPVVFVQSCEDGVTTIDPPDGLFDL
jgi:16S rRNA processing protein RimM